MTNSELKKAWQEFIQDWENKPEKDIREKLKETEYKISKDGKVVSDFSKPRLITSMEKDANPTFMQRVTGNGGIRFTPVSQLAVKLMYKIGDKTKGKGHGGEKSYLTAEEAFRNKVVVVDTDYMIVPNPY